MKLRKLKKLRQAYRKLAFSQIIQRTFRKYKDEIFANLTRTNSLFRLVQEGKYDKPGSP